MVNFLLQDNQRVSQAIISMHISSRELSCQRRRVWSFVAGGPSAKGIYIGASTM